MKPRVNLLILGMIILVSACTSSQKLLEKGQYDAAISHAVKKLMKNPDNNEEVSVLQRAYSVANQQDNERINQLRISGQPNIWSDINARYEAMRTRQNKVKVLPQSALNAINYQYVNYDQEIATSKQKAAEYFYSHAMTLLQKEDKQSARQAYDELQRVKSYFATFKDVDEQLKKARFLGTTFVNYLVVNNTQMVIPKTFEEDLYKLPFNELNIGWIQYDPVRDKNIRYEYDVVLNLRSINISGDQVKEERYTESKEIPDGFNYLFDKNGNVMKDSLGNDIKIPKTKIISCQVTETFLFKSSMVTADLEYYKNESNQLIKSVPIKSEWVFRYFMTYAQGDMSALRDETRAKLNSAPVPFPAQNEMLYKNAVVLKDQVKYALKNNNTIIN